MEGLRDRFIRMAKQVNLGFVRYLYDEVRWDQSRLIAITGPRGVGKTTMLFQHILRRYPDLGREVLYVTLDDIYFATNSLVDLAESFYNNGGQLLVLDEVHKYNTWAREIKNIYDFYPELKIVFTGSSLLKILQGEADLSRRVTIYKLYGLSLREFIQYDRGISFDAIGLDELLKNHVSFSRDITAQLKPIAAFSDYLHHGYFPYYKTEGELYHGKLLQTIDTILEIDLPAAQQIEYSSISKIRKLFALLAKSVPVIPNISMLSREIGVSRVSLLNYLCYLERAQLLMLLSKDASGFKPLAKPEKVYLGNTNYAFALQPKDYNMGNLRETFFFNQLQVKHKVARSDKTDFIIDGSLSFEVGGKNKDRRQIADVANSYLAIDDIEYGNGNRVPLWMFGFLY